MYLTKSERDYYDGLESLNVAYPMRYLLNHIGDENCKGRSCPQLASDDEKKLLTPEGIRYLRNKWAMRICDMYLNSDVVINTSTRYGQRARIENCQICLKDDFEEFWSRAELSDFVECAAVYHAAHELNIDSGVPARYLRNVSINRQRSIMSRWAYREAATFGDYFDEFHLRYAGEMDFPNIVISYIAFLPYSWLVTEEKEEKTSLDNLWIRGTATREKNGKIIFSPLGHPEIRINIACSYPGEDYRGISPLEKDIRDRECFLKTEYAGETSDNRVILNVWNDDREGGADRIILSIYDMCRLVADM